MPLVEHCIHRCFELARLGIGKVSPNPPVGAVIWHEGCILGEGYHQAYGQAHAEVQAVASVLADQKHLLRESTLYVSLEPCCFYGKTPPCTSLILETGIPRVVISCLDHSPEVSGKGVSILREHGVEVITGILEEEGKRLSAPRKVFALENRPYTILKFAQSQNGMMGGSDAKQIWISNPLSGRLVHKWRAEVDAIMVGRKTAQIDDPSLTTRYYPGKNPLRIVLDRKAVLPADLKLFDGTAPTLCVSEKPRPEGITETIDWLRLDFNEMLLNNLNAELHARNIGTLMVEGGKELLSSYMRQNLWDETRVITGTGNIENGLSAPVFQVEPAWHGCLGDNRIDVFFPSN